MTIPSDLRLALVCCLLATAMAQAQDPARRGIALAEAVERVRQHHPLIVAAKRRVAIAEAEKLDAGLRPNPSFSISGENFPLGPTERGFSFAGSLDWFATYSHTFETGDKRRLRVLLAERNLETSQAEAEAVERQVVYEAKLAYQLVSISRLRVELLRENLNNLNYLVSLNEVRVREGYTAEGDLIKARLEGQRVEYQLRKASLEHERAKIGLLRAMGASSFEDGDLNFEIVEDLDYRQVSLNAALLQEAAMRLPQALVAQSRVERAQALLRLEQARARPDVIASVGYKRNGPDNALYGALTVPLPIYQRNQGQVARAQAEVEMAEAELKYTRNVILAELAAARRAVEMNRKQVENLRADFLLRADESRSVSLAAYREGAVDLIVLLDAQRVRAQAQELYYQALYDYRVAIHELERAAGIERLPEQTDGVQTPGGGK